MAIKGLADINNAYENGRFWRTDYTKLTGGISYTAGRWYDLTMCSGNPRTNVYPGSMLTATKLWYKSGGSPWDGGPVSPYSKHLVSMSMYGNYATGPSTWVLCDFLLFYPLIDMDLNTEQVMDNTVTLPRYVTGEGVMAYMVITADTGGSAHYVTLNYTNSAGVSGRTSPAFAGSLSGIPGQFSNAGVAAGNLGPFIPLADGDHGIRSVESVTLDSGSGGGYCALVLVKPIFFASIIENLSGAERFTVFNDGQFPKIEDEAFLGLMGHVGVFQYGNRYNACLDFVWG